MTVAFITEVSRNSSASAKRNPKDLPPQYGYGALTAPTLILRKQTGLYEPILGSGPEKPVAEIAESRQNVFFRVELAIERGRDDPHPRMILLHLGHAFR